MIGKILGGRYRIVKLLATGGFGQTFIAQDTHRPGHPQCVVKHLHPATCDTNVLQSARRLFQAEAETLEKLGNCDRIPQLLAHLEEDGEFYLVQEFIVGHPLSAELLPGCCWSESQVVQLLHEVLGILEFVHCHGLIHRDIKPSNIIRRQHDNRLVLIDFGSVKQAWTQVLATEKTNATIAIGTPGYMSTEQSRGKPRPNSDIYALGIIGIQALAGLHPTQLAEDCNTGEILWQHQAQVSKALAAVLSQMVRYHFKDRYQTVAEVLQALQPLVNRQGLNTGEVVPRLWQTKKFQMLMSIGATAAIATSLNLTVFQPPDFKSDTNPEQISTLNVQEQYVENRNATTSGFPSPSPVLSPPIARQLTDRQLQEIAIIATDKSELDRFEPAKAIAPPIPADASIPQTAQNKVKPEISRLPSRNTATRPAARTISSRHQRRTTQRTTSSSAKPKNAKPRKLTVRRSNSSTPKQFQRHTSRRATSRSSSAWRVEVR